MLGFAHERLHKFQLIHAHVGVEGFLGLVAGGLHDGARRHALVELERDEGLAADFGGEVKAGEAY